MTPGTAFSGFALAPPSAGQARRNGAARGITAASDFTGLAPGDVWLPGDGGKLRRVDGKFAGEAILAARRVRNDG